MLAVSFTTFAVQPGVQNARSLGTQKTSLSGYFEGSCFETRIYLKVFLETECSCQYLTLVTAKKMNILRYCITENCVMGLTCR